MRRLLYITDYGRPNTIPVIEFAAGVGEEQAHVLRLVFNPEVMEPAGGPSYDGTGFANSGWLQEEATELS